MKKNISCILLTLLILPVMAPVTQADTPKSFYPTWKLMKPAEKKRFLAGYIHGWQDAKRVTDILVDHVESQPDDAVKSLEKVRDIYGIADIPVDELLRRVTTFYSEIENHDAPLSVAMSSGR